MKAVVCIFLATIVAAYAQNDIFCGGQGAWEASDWASLIQTLQTIPNELLRKDTAITSISSSNLGVTGLQLVQLFSCFQNELLAQDILEAITAHILGMSCMDAANILNQWNNELLRLNILPYIANQTYDLAQNNQTILLCFNNVFNRRDAYGILEAASPISCVWGNIVLSRFIFVVDVSGSMSTSFLDPVTGNTYTRLQYVAQQLNDVMTRSLNPSQEFNIIAFSDSARAWQKGIVPVTTANINSAVQFVTALQPGGGTSMLNALNTAFADSSALGIYLLSDGQPTDATAQQILQAAVKWSKGQKPLNTVAFQLGGTFDPNAAAFMEQLADQNNGVFRLFK